MAVLAQAYLHLNPYNVSQGDLQNLGANAFDLSFRAAKEIYGGNVQLDVRLEQGSAKTWATVFGAITAVHVSYGVVANYKGFKESVVELCSDAGSFGEVVCGSLIKKAGASDGQVYRMERRRKTPGKIGRLLERLEVADELSSQGKLSRSELARQIEAAQSELLVIQRSLEPKDQEALGKFLVFKNLPPLNYPTHPYKGRSGRVVVLPGRREDELFPEQEREAAELTPQKSNLVYHKFAFVP